MGCSTFFSLFAALLMLNGCTSTEYLLDEKLSKFKNVYNDGEAHFVDGELQLIAEKNWFFSTRKIYEDFVLEAEVMMPDTSEYSNSGIIFRGQIIETDKGKQIIGYQVDIDPSDRKWTGGLLRSGPQKVALPNTPHPFSPR